MLKPYFQLVIDELLEWDAGEAGVGKDYVGRWLVQVVLVLGDVVWRKAHAETINHHALRHTQRLTDV